jgi:hypothetical protein
MGHGEVTVFVVGGEINCRNTAQLRNISLKEDQTGRCYNTTIPIDIFRILNFRSPVMGGAFG